MKFPPINLWSLPKRMSDLLTLELYYETLKLKVFYSIHDDEVQISRIALDGWTIPFMFISDEACEEIVELLFAHLDGNPQLAH